MTGYEEAYCNERAELRYLITPSPEKITSPSI